VYDGRVLGVWACGAVGSALPWHGRGQGFESLQVHQYFSLFINANRQDFRDLISSSAEPAMEESNDRVRLLRFIAPFKNHRVESDSPGMRHILALFFNAPGIDYQDLANVAASALVNAPEISDLISRNEQGAVIEPVDLRALDHPLTHKLLRRAVVTDLPLERLLVAVRSCCLNTAITDPAALTGHLP
jgi:hypothetical protein